jgi:hypothetical protein
MYLHTVHIRKTMFRCMHSFKERIFPFFPFSFSPLVRMFHSTHSPTAPNELRLRRKKYAISTTPADSKGTVRLKNRLVFESDSKISFCLLREDVIQRKRETSIIFGTKFF